MNYALNNLIINKIIENEIAACIPGTPDHVKESLRTEFRQRLNLYKSYAVRTKNFWQRYNSYINSKEWRELRETVFKRDNYECLLFRKVWGF